MWWHWHLLQSACYSAEFACWSARCNVGVLAVFIDIYCNISKSFLSKFISTELNADVLHWYSCVCMLHVVFHWLIGAELAALVLSGHSALVIFSLLWGSLHVSSTLHRPCKSVASLYKYFVSNERQVNTQYLCHFVCQCLVVVEAAKHIREYSVKLSLFCSKLLSYLLSSWFHV